MWVHPGDDVGADRSVDHVVIRQVALVHLGNLVLSQYGKKKWLSLPEWKEVKVPVTTFHLLHC